MLRGVFVTGTDTGVGKTVVSALLMHRYGTGVRHVSDTCLTPGTPATAVRYWKPIQTGIEQDDDTRTVRRLSGCGEAGILDAGVRLPRLLSPHLAASLSGGRIDLVALTDIILAQPESDRWIVEGAGGVLVPMNDSELMADLMTALRLPILVVARTALGTINHTLLTLEALRARSLLIAGVLMVGDRNPENRSAIERYGRVQVVGELPRLDPLTRAALGRWSVEELDPDGRLAGLFP